MTQCQGYNYDFTDADAHALCHYAALLNQPQHPHHNCGWMTAHGVCGLPVPGLEFPDHLRSHHGVVGPDKTPLTCCWDGCFMEMKKESLMRHINEKHLELRFACPNCSERFTRNYTMQNHISRKHSGS